MSRRGGRIRHVMPALDASFAGGQHRNRGLCSVPRAFKWIDFSSEFLSDLEHFELKAFKRKRKGDHWTRIALVPSGEIISRSVEHVILSLAQSAPDHLGEGSHLIHSIIDFGNGIDWCTLKYPGGRNELCITLDNRKDIPNLEQDGRGILHVTMTATMAGSESPYLPEVYKALFEDKALRNPAYETFREKREQQNK